MTDIQNDKTKDSIIKAHALTAAPHPTYPCFFKYTNNSEGVAVFQFIGSLERYQAYVQGNPKEHSNKFVLLCRNKCKPCSVAKHYIRGRSENTKRSITILEQSNDSLTWKHIDDEEQEEEKATRVWALV